MEGRRDASFPIRPIRLYGHIRQVRRRLHRSRLGEDCRDRPNQRRQKVLEAVALYPEKGRQQNKVEYKGGSDNARCDPQIRPQRLEPGRNQTLRRYEKFLEDES